MHFLEFHQPIRVKEIVRIICDVLSCCILTAYTASLIAPLGSCSTDSELGIDALLEQFIRVKDVHSFSYIEASRFNQILNASVSGVVADVSNHDKNQQLQQLLQLVVKDEERLSLYEDVARRLLEAGYREQAGILGFNLAESMDKNVRGANASVQRGFLRRSIDAFPENPIAIRSLGYRLEQSGEEIEAMELYNDALRRNPQRLDLRLLLASSCSPFQESITQGTERCKFQEDRRMPG